MLSRKRTAGSIDLTLDRWLGTGPIGAFESEEEIREYFSPENLRYMWGEDVDTEEAEDAMLKVLDLWRNMHDSRGKKIIAKVDISPETFEEWVSEYGEDFANALEDLCNEESLDPDRIQVDSGYHGFSVSFGEIVTVQIGSLEYGVAGSSDAAEELAVEVVTHNLEQEPGIFSQDWLARFIDEDQLQRALWSDVSDMIRYEIKDEADRRPEETAERMGIDVDDYYDKNYDLDEDKLRDAIDDKIDYFVEQETDSRLSDPIGYLVDIYGEQDGLERAIEISGIDIDAAARDAVATDGAEHFLAQYDGNFSDLVGGAVYWRIN